MPHVTRHSIFETNSSSTHSIAIRTTWPTTLSEQDRLWSRIPVEEDGVCRVWAGEFGWEVETYYDAPTKASYALTYLKSFGDREPGRYKYPKTGDSPFWEGEPPGTKELWLQMLKDAIMARTGAKKVEFLALGIQGYGDNPNDLDWGSIDHQSLNVCRPAFESQETLEAFIFNPESFLHTDNDNH